MDQEFDVGVSVAYCNDGDAWREDVFTGADVF
jgi:hypothetical protein